MEFLLTKISEASCNVEKMPAVLISSGVIQAAAALALAFFKAPRGIFLHHGKAPYYFYYGIQISIVIFGLAEASAGFWVSGDLISRRAIGKTVLWISILPLVIVLAFGGFLVLK
jgi:hypothetical protein